MRDPATLAMLSLLLLSLGGAGARPSPQSSEEIPPFLLQLLCEEYPEEYSEYCEEINPEGYAGVDVDLGLGLENKSPQIELLRSEPSS